VVLASLGKICIFAAIINAIILHYWGRIAVTGSVCVKKLFLFQYFDAKNLLGRKVREFFPSAKRQPRLYFRINLFGGFVLSVSRITLQTTMTCSLNVSKIFSRSAVGERLRVEPATFRSPVQ